MQRFFSFYYMLGAVVDALASNKPLHGSRHAETLVLADSGVQPELFVDSQDKGAQRNRQRRDKGPVTTTTTTSSWIWGVPLWAVSVQPEHNSSGRLDQVDGLVQWGRCSKRQLEGDWKPVHSDKCINVNLVYVRIPKCASTSFTSVLRRVSARYGVSGVDANNWLLRREPTGLPEPFLSSYHEWFRNMKGMVREATLPIAKVTMLREPKARALSQFYYSASYGVKAKIFKDMGLLKSLKWKSENLNNFMFQYLGSEGEMDVHKVMDQYDLIGVTERFDESVVLLMEKFGLSYCDVMYSNGKDYVHDWAPKTEHGLKVLESIPFSEQPKEIQDYLESKEFQEAQKLDFQAYNYAQQHMDKLIGAMGREKFEAKLKDFVKWKDDVLDKCRVSEVEGRSARKNICYFHGDCGCGYKCFDEICKENPK